jgi:hypothetical protein
MEDAKSGTDGQPRSKPNPPGDIPVDCFLQNHRSVAVAEFSQITR